MQRNASETKDAAANESNECLNECMECARCTELSDIFYTSQKKGHAFRVKLDASGLTLQRESATGAKLQSVKMCDIVGGRCVRRVQKAWRLGGNCGACTSSSSCTVLNDPTSVKAVSPGAAAVAVSNGDGDASAYLYVFAYVLKKNLRNILRRERTVITLRFRSFDTFEENMREADLWYRALKRYKHLSLNEPYHSPRGERRRRLLVLLNPKSGSGKARELFHRHVAPLLNESELPYDLHVTKYFNFARDFVRQRNLDAWSGIVAVGGDGIFHEILNGLIQRSDWRQALQRLSLGIVPCGSGNGLARSIAHLYKEPYEPKPILCAALTLTSGKVTPMDVVRIQLENQVLYSFLTVGWGLISDVDIESERLRSLGHQRFTVWTLYRLMNLRTYRGRISYSLKSNISVNDFHSDYAEPVLRHSQSCNAYLNSNEHKYFQSSESLDNCYFDDVISLETGGNESFRSRCNSWFSVGSRKSNYYSITDSIYHSVAGDSDYELEHANANNFAIDRKSVGPNASTPSLHEAVPEHWVTEEGSFVMVHAAYQSHIGADCFFAPSAKLSDSVIYLVIIRGGIGRAQLFSFLYNMSTGTHLPKTKNEFIKIVACDAFRIEPFDADGILTIDGERVAYGAVQAEVISGIAKVMVPK